MTLHDLEIFNENLVESVNEEFQLDPQSPIQVFTKIVIEYLKMDRELEPILSNSYVKSYLMTAEHMQVNGYAINETLNTLTIIVSDYNDSLSVSKINNGDAEKLIKQGSNYFRAYKKGFFSEVSPASTGFQIATDFHESFSEPGCPGFITIILITNRVSNEAVEIPPINIAGTDVNYEIWDLERIWQVCAEKNSRKPIEIHLSKYNDGKSQSLQMLKVEGRNPVYDCYVGYISGILLGKIFQDFRQRLLEQNVRAFLSDGKGANKKIRTALEKEPEMFMAYNNGISTVAEAITCVKANDTATSLVNVTDLTGWQIVNGGQTTVSIYNAYLKSLNDPSLDLSQVYVQMKLTVLNESVRKSAQKTLTTITNIAFNANNQNPVKLSDFKSNHPYHISMLKWSKSTAIPVDGGKGKSSKYWYYEKARGEYLAEYSQLKGKEKAEFKDNHKLITKIDAAKCWMLWEQKPWYVAKGAETNFKIFSEMLDEGKIVKLLEDDKYEEPSKADYIHIIAQHILFTQTYAIIKKLNLGEWKTQLADYTVSLLSFYNNNIAERGLVDDNAIWEHQSISGETAVVIEKLVYFIWDYFMHAVSGVNIGQKCKREECWNELKEQFIGKFC